MPLNDRRRRQYQGTDYALVSDLSTLRRLGANAYAESNEVWDYPEGLSILPVELATWNGTFLSHATVITYNPWSSEISGIIGHAYQELITQGQGETRSFRRSFNLAGVGSWDSWGALSTTVATDAYAEADDLTDYPDGISIMAVSATADWHGFGENCLVITRRTSLYSDQTLHASGHTYSRDWFSGAWQSWKLVLTEPLADLRYVKLDDLRFKEFPLDAAAEADPLTDYAEGVTIFPVSATAAWDGWAYDAQVVTYRTGDDLGYQYRTFIAGAAERRAYRFWLTAEMTGTVALWDAWVMDADQAYVDDKANNVVKLAPLSTDFATEAAAITSYDNGVSIMPVSAGANWGPNTGEAGYVKTDRNGATGKQTFVVPSTSTSYTRYYTGGAWGSWQGPTLAEDAHAEADSITTYPNGISIMPVSAGANWDGNGGAAIVTTDRTGTGGVQYAYYYEADWQYYGVRFFDTSAWSDWFYPNLSPQIYLPPLPEDFNDEASDITSYIEGFTIMSVTGAANWGPNTGEVGHVVTERNGDTAGKQTFVVPSTATSYTRYYTGGAWGSWSSGGGGGWTAVDASTTTKGILKTSVAPASATDPIAVGDNDGRVPTPGENDALVGTNGTPGSGNKYVTDSDARNTNTRTPTDSSVTNAKVDAAAAIDESKLNLASDAAAGTASRRSLGSGATQAAPGNDSRLSDARAPTAHNINHGWGGVDPVKPTVTTEQTIGAAGIIATGTSCILPVTATADRTLVTLQAGAFTGQFVYVINRSAFSLTFHTTESTGLVAGGGAVAPNSSSLFVWDGNYGGSGVGRWVKLPTDAAAAIASLRTLGTGATQATAGNDSRLSDTRTPTDSSVTDAKVAAAAAIAESKLNLASDAAAGTASRRTLGTGATQAAPGNDSRLSDARAPTTREFEAVFFFGSTLTTQVGVGKFKLPNSGTPTITEVTISVNTLPTGASVICDVNSVNNSTNAKTTLYSTQGNRPTIAVGGNYSNVATLPNTTQPGAGVEISVDIDQIGSTIAGSDLVVIVRGTY